MDLPYLQFEPSSIFVAPLNWGLGHATRSADVILRLQSRFPNAQITLGSDGVAADWLRQRFPDLTVLKIPAYNIRYSRGAALIPKLILRSPLIALSIIREHTATEKIVRRYKADLVVSDNRYGVWSRRCHSVFITHQLQIRPSGRLMKPLFCILNSLIFRGLKRFDQCWIPDFEEYPGLAGKLSHPGKLSVNARYIGPLSRFRWVAPEKPPEDPPWLLCIISGPEPQRGIFLDLILKQLKQMSVKTVIVAGSPGKVWEGEVPDHIKIFTHLPDETLMSLIQKSYLVISRPGYSTIMDLHFTGGKALFVPTPGQTEQEYLADLHKSSANIQSISQKDFQTFKLSNFLTYSLTSKAP